MRIGYACITEGEKTITFKTCNLKNASDETLYKLIEHNLNSLENAVDYNIANKIMLYRINSGLIPFGSSPANKLDWSKLFEKKFKAIGKKIIESGMRVSMHPGQYTVLNSINEEVVKRAVDDLVYHNLILDSLGVNSEHKIVLHIGGVYNDKDEAMNRFVSNYAELNTKIKARLIIENDDKSYNIDDVLEISSRTGIPVVFDNLHHFLNHDSFNSDKYYIDLAGKTWKSSDGKQKIHYSQQDKIKRNGSHSNTIDVEEFLLFYRNLSDKEIDIMLEVKDKNYSTLKCIDAIKQ